MNYKCENKVKDVRRIDGQEELYFTEENRYKNLFGLKDERKELDAKIQEDEQGRSGFSFDSMMKLTFNFFKYHYIGASN